MTSLHPCLALALAVLCILISGKPAEGKRFLWPSIWAVVSYLVFVSASTFCAIKLGHLDDQRAVIFSSVAGVGVCLLSVVFSDLSVGVAIAIAAAGASMPHLVRADSFPAICLVYAFSAAIGSVFFSTFQGAVVAGVTGGIVTMTDYLGKAGEQTGNHALIGVALGIALTVAAVVYVAVKKALPLDKGRLDPVLVVVLSAGAGYVVSKWAVGGDLWIVLGIASLSALVVNWLIPMDSEPQPFRVGLATVIWLALGTIAFSMLRGFGMASAVLEGMIVLLLLGNGRAVATMGPLMGLVIYRVLRDASPDSSRAIDLGQHYGVTGIAIGALIPVLYADWSSRKLEIKAAQDSVASFLWGFVLVCLPVLSIVVLGAKGASGIVVGLGFSGFLLAYRRTWSLATLGVVIAAGAANGAAVDWIGDAMDLTRQEKLHSFGWWALAMAIAAIGIVAVSWKRVSPEAM